MGGLLLPLFCLVGSMLFTSCEETAGIDEYANWQERNEALIRFVADSVKINSDGEWRRILSFKLDSVDAQGNPIEHGVEDYIYCQIVKDSAGSTHPLYTETVSVNYRGRLMPSASYPEGMVFDESYKGSFNPMLNAPRNFRVDDLIVGWSTALMHMTVGDTWRVYIPAALGYGAVDKNNIPAYSTLIFEMNLADIL